MSRFLIPMAFALVFSLFSSASCLAGPYFTIYGFDGFSVDSNGIETVNLTDRPTSFEAGMPLTLVIALEPDATTPVQALEMEFEILFDADAMSVVPTASSERFRLNAEISSANNLPSSVFYFGDQGNGLTLEPGRIAGDLNFFGAGLFTPPSITNPTAIYLLTFELNPNYQGETIEINFTSGLIDGSQTSPVTTPDFDPVFEPFDFSLVVPVPEPASSQLLACSGLLAAGAILIVRGRGRNRREITMAQPLS